MEDVAVVDSHVGGLSQAERVVDTFVAPSKTFLDLFRSTAWWLPFILSIGCYLAFLTVAVHKVGQETMTQTMLHKMPAMEEKMASAPPDQQAAMRKGFENQTKPRYLLAPPIAIVFSLIVGGLFLVSANFFFGGTAKFWQMVAVYWYGMMPLVVHNLICMAILGLGSSPESYDISNPLGTNPGFYMTPDHFSPFLIAIGSALDLFTIWVIYLQILGVATVAKIKMSSATIAVLIWWVLWVLLKSLPSLLFA